MLHQKKMSTVAILKILKEQTDEDHPMTQEQIRQALADKEEIQIERKAVKSSLEGLVGMNIGVRCDERKRSQMDPKTGARTDQTLTTNYYMEREFTRAELHLLKDSVVFSSHIPVSQRRDLIRKLERLQSQNDKKIYGKIEFPVQTVEQNKDIFQYIEDLEQAIHARKGVEFTCNEYKFDKMQHPVLQPVYSFKGRPCRIEAARGHYYILCQEESVDELTAFRLDKITDLRIIADPLKGIPFIDMDKYFREHPVMSSGRVSCITLGIREEAIGDLIDAFGTNFTVAPGKLEDPSIAGARAHTRYLGRREDPEDRMAEMYQVALKANEDDMYHWALEHGEDVIVQKPVSLRARLRATVESMADRYLSTNEDYLEKMIEEAKEGKFLFLDGIDIRGREKDLILPEITTLDVGAYVKGDLSMLSGLPKLTRMSVSRPRRDLSFLEDFGMLKELVLRHTGLTDLKILEKFPYLERLALNEEPRKEFERKKEREKNRSLRLLAKMNQEEAQREQEGAGARTSGEGSPERPAGGKREAMKQEVHPAIDMPESDGKEESAPEFCNVETLYKLKSLKSLRISRELAEVLDLGRLKEEIPGLEIVINGDHIFRGPERL